LRYRQRKSEGALRGLETQWHKFTSPGIPSWASFKVKQRGEETKSFWGSKK